MTMTMEAAVIILLETMAAVQDGRPRVVLVVKVTGEVVTVKVTEEVVTGEMVIVIGIGVIPSAGVLVAVGAAAAASPLTRRRRSCHGRR
jgi:hypothetical protein